MKKVIWYGYLFTLALFVLVGWLGSSHAEESTPATPQRDEKKQEDANQKIEVLAQEVEKLKAGQDLFPTVGEGKYGFSPAASKVYSSKGGLSFGGYGEINYAHFSGDDESGTPSGKKDMLDMTKLILYTGYKFNPKILFNSEIEFEHSTTEANGAVSVEFAYLDFLWKEALNFRAGLMLMPMGFTNELHEPTVFLGVNRPLEDRLIIPGTWREPGVGIFGNFKDLQYRAFLVTGFDGVGGGNSGASGFSAKGLRSGRQKGSEASAEGLAFVGRVDYTRVPGLFMGASGYVGNSGQENQTPTAEKITALTTITEVHADYKWKGFEGRGQWVYTYVDQADRINAAKGLTGADSIGKALMGYYLQLGYDVLRSVQSEHQLIPFFRYEALNTQRSVPAGFAKNPENDQKVYTVGTSYKPIMNIAVKADYEFHRNEAGTGVDQFNLGLGYLF